MYYLFGFDTIRRNSTRSCVYILADVQSSHLPAPNSIRFGIREYSIRDLSASSTIHCQCQMSSLSFKGSERIVHYN